MRNAGKPRVEGTGAEIRFAKNILKTCETIKALEVDIKVT